MAKDSKTHTIVFNREKETKNTVKFEEKPEPGKPAMIGSLYVQKWAAGDATTVKLTVEFGS